MAALPPEGGLSVVVSGTPNEKTSATEPLPGVHVPLESPAPGLTVMDASNQLAPTPIPAAALPITPPLSIRCSSPVASDADGNQENVSTQGDSDGRLNQEEEARASKERRKKRRAQDDKTIRRHLLEKITADLAELAGLEAAKDRFQALEGYVENNTILGVETKRETFHAVFQGNPGTGKTTTARLYAKLLFALGILNAAKVIEKTGAELAITHVNGFISEFNFHDPETCNMCIPEDSNGSDPNSDDSDDCSDDPETFRYYLKSRQSLPKSDQKVSKFEHRIQRHESRAEHYPGGVLIVDEAYQLVAPHNQDGGKSILDRLLDAMEKHRGQFVVIFVGYKTDLEAFFAQNEGLAGRVPYVVNFEDFNETQLHLILSHQFDKRYTSRAVFEGGLDGVYIQAAVRRLAAERGGRGFGNARAVEHLVSVICQRQAQRIRQLEDASIENRLFFTKEDILGPRPSDVRGKSAARSGLQTLVGLRRVKDAVDDVFYLMEENYERELQGKKPWALSLNRIFLGSPGTGKTTVAKLYGRILAELGLLSKGEVVMKSPSDFIGASLGVSESNTKSILAATVGKVLVINEAYMLDPGNAKGDNRDTSRAAVLDILVAEVQGNPGNDRCVILMGCEDKMQSLFQNGHPGLPGRFMADKPFRFDDYDEDELKAILNLELKSRDIQCAESAVEAAMGALSRAKNNPSFSNGREVKSLVSMGVSNYLSRQNGTAPGSRYTGVITAEDFDTRLDPAGSLKPELARVDCRSLLTGMVSESVIGQLEDYFPGLQASQSANTNTRPNRSRLVPRTYILHGPTGTGKSAVARQLGPLFYNMGLTSSARVVECSAADFIGQHAGQTISATRACLDRGLGNVLVIDDLDSLRVDRGGYQAEALGELVAFVEKHSAKTIVVLTAQTETVDALLQSRSSLASLFQDEIIFKKLTAKESLAILDQLLRSEGVLAPFFVSEATRMGFENVMETLCQSESWTNYMDIKQLSRRILRQIPDEMWITGKFQDELLCLTDEIPLACIKAMFLTKTLRY